MSATRHLPAAAEMIANQQGWNDDSLVSLLAAFIVKRGLEPDLVQHLADAAEEENAELGSEEGEFPY